MVLVCIGKIIKDGRDVFERGERLQHNGVFNFAFR